MPRTPYRRPSNPSRENTIYDWGSRCLQPSWLKLDAYQQLQQAYPLAQTIYVVVDKWPVHYHPNVLAALQPQQTPFPLTTPASWSNVKPKVRYKTLNLPIELVPLPPYGSNKVGAVRFFN